MVFRRDTNHTPAARSGPDEQPGPLGDHMIHIDIRSLLAFTGEMLIAALAVLRCAG